MTVPIAPLLLGIGFIAGWCVEGWVLRFGFRLLTKEQRVQVGVWLDEGRARKKAKRRAA